MKFTKILDVTESDLPLVQTHCERQTNDMLEYDESDFASNDNDYGDDDDGVLEHDMAIIHPETKDILDDWKCAEIKVDEILSDPNIDEPRYHDLSAADSDSSMDSFFKPEADQNIQLLSDDAIQAMRRHNTDYTTIARADDDEQ